MANDELSGSGSGLTGPSTEGLAPNMRSLLARYAQPQATQPSPESQRMSALLNEGISRQPAATPKREGMLTGTGRAAMAGLEGMGADVAGLGQYTAQQLGDEGAIQQGFGNWRDALNQKAAQAIQSLSPLDQELLHRSAFTLDPHKTLFQGGPQEMVHSVALQVANQLPPTLATLLPAGKIMKAGMTGRALTYIGATQAGLSAGAIANNIREDIQQTPDDQLAQQSPRYAELLHGGMDSATAKEQLIKEAQGKIPLIGGLVTGAIAAAAGRYLEPVLVGEGGPIGSRMVRGALSQGIQGGAFAGTERVAKDAAAKVYDASNGGPSASGFFESAGEGATGGVPLGALFGAIHGGNPRPERTVKPPLSTEGVPEEHHTAGPGELRQEPLGDVTNRTAQPNKPVWRGGDVEAGRLQPEMASGVQGELGFGQTGSQAGPETRHGAAQASPHDQSRYFTGEGGVPNDQAAALQAHYGEGNAPVQADMFAPPEQNLGTPIPGPGGADMRQVAMHQQELPLQGGLMHSQERGLIPSPARPQMDLPLEQRLPGVGRQPIPPGEGVPNMPPEQPQPGELARGRRPTRADFIRERAAQQRAQDMAGVDTRGNLDLFRGPGEQPMDWGPDVTQQQQMAARAAREAGTAVGGEQFGERMGQQVRTRPAARSPAEASEQLIETARQAMRSEKERSRWQNTGEEVVHPDDVHFTGEDADKVAERYSDLYHEYAGQEIMRRQGESVRDKLAARKRQGQLAERMQRILNINEHDTTATQIAKTALGVDRETVERLRRENQNARAQGERVERVARPREIRTETLGIDKVLSRKEIARMGPDDLDSAFLKAVEYAGTRPGAERTTGDLVRQYGRAPSLKRKLLNRVHGMLEQREAYGNTDTRARSYDLTASPRRALTERERMENAARRQKQGSPGELFRESEMAPGQGSKAKPTGEPTRAFRTLPVEALLSTAEDRRAYEQGVKTREAREGRREVLRGKMEKAVGDVEKLHQQMAKSRHEDATTARSYLREILQYGRSLRDRGLPSVEAMQGAEKFLKLVGDLKKLNANPRADYLARTRETEIANQQRLAARARPEVLEEGYKSTEELARLQEKRTAKLQRDAAAVQEVRQNEETSDLQHVYGAFDAQSAGRFSSETENAARALGSMFEERNGRPLQDVLDEARKHLSPDHPFAEILHKLSNLRMGNVLVGFAPRERFSSYGGSDVVGHMAWSHEGPHFLRFNRGFFEDKRASGKDPSIYFMHALAHEATHAATTLTIARNDRLHAELATLVRAAREQLGEKSHYGLSNANEFVAEAFSNRSFQQALDSVKLAHTSLWERFKDFVRRSIGLESTQRSVLDRMFDMQHEIFRGDTGPVTKGEVTRLRELPLLDRKTGAQVGNAIDRVMKTARLEGDIRERFGDAGEALKNGVLSLTSPHQLREAFSKHFQRADGSNPFKEYWDSYFQRNADNNKMMERVTKLSSKWSTLEEKYGIDRAHDFSSMLHDATFYKVHPDLPLDATANAHLVGHDAAEARYTELRDKYKAMPEEYQQHYQELKHFFAGMQREAVRQIQYNMLHAIMTKGAEAPMTAAEFEGKYQPKDMDQFQTDRAVKDAFGDKIDDMSAGEIARVSKILNRGEGPYFPLMRFGDYVVTAERALADRTFRDSDAAREAMDKLRGSDPSLRVSLAKGDDGTYTVKTSEREVRMAESKAEARAHQRELNEKYGAGNVSPVQLRSDVFAPNQNIATGASLNRILEKLSDNPAAQSAVKNFYLQSLAEQSFRKRELSRSYVRGVDVENQHRALAAYGRSASYYISQLRHGRDLANSLAGVHQMVRNHTDESQISATRMGEVAKQIALRDEIARDPARVNKLTKFATSFTQFSMMTSVSHWFVRASQPYMLSVPWLAARHGLGETWEAMNRAQKLIASPLINETTDSMAGLRTLIARSAASARASAERSFGVLDQVMDHIKGSGDPKAAEYNSVLQNLRDNGIIDMSLANELKDIAKGEQPMFARVKNASSEMLHLVEVNNRAMTALAAYDLGRARGMSKAAAIEHARDAVVITHNDYSYGNTPLAFMNQKGTLGGMRSLMTQFMRYPQHVYAMLVQATAQAMHGESAEVKRVGWKTLGGILATHALVGGAMGVAVQPIKWAIGLAAMAASMTGATSQPFSFANAISGDAYDRIIREVTNDLFGSDVGEVVAGGLPRALGADLSQRLALGTIYFTHIKTDSNESILGSLIQSFGGPWLSQLSEMANGVQHLAKGEIARAAESFSPHILRDIVRFGRISQTGLTSNGGNTLIPAEKLTPEELFLTSIGISPERFSEVYAKRAVESDVSKQLQDKARDLVSRYASASPESRAEILDEISQFRKDHPAYAPSRSALIKAQQSKAMADVELARFGAKIRAKQVPEMSGYGAAYNTGG